MLFRTTEARPRGVEVEGLGVAGAEVDAADLEVPNCLADWQLVA